MPAGSSKAAHGSSSFVEQRSISRDLKETLILEEQIEHRRNRSMAFNARDEEALAIPPLPVPVLLPLPIMAASIAVRFTRCSSRGRARELSSGGGRPPKTRRRLRDAWTRQRSATKRKWQGLSEGAPPRPPPPPPPPPSILRRGGTDGGGISWPINYAAPGHRAVALRFRSLQLRAVCESAALNLEH